MSLALLFLAACADQVTITPGQGACTDYDPADPAESTVESDISKDGSARVWRSNALREQTGLIFDPVIEVGGDIVSVFEAWTGGETDDALCYEPIVSFQGVTRDLQVRWYLQEGDPAPFDSVDIEAP
ncbi:MAG: hypothetical protein Q8P18_11530 [Pseudomonadota bacterium]|nr:hypothetical protein [Pseudomonadota bacterium]